jgi:hypothetical protein
MSKNADQKYQLLPDGKYVIEDFDQGMAFSSFLPGIGGVDGVPLWCMYVNRGQSVVSFGVANKDNSIAEFLPATWAYQLVTTQGFRTFCKIDGAYYEPFQKGMDSRVQDIKRSMSIEPDRLSISETNRTLGLTFDVDYFSPVNKPIGSLFRVLKVTNLTKRTQTLDVLDGLGLILPIGYSDFGIKAMRRISEAYASVRLVCQKVPFYASKVVAHDEAEVTKVVQGNFYASWQVVDGKLEQVEPFVDPDLIFGPNNDLVTPRLFIDNDEIDRDAQIWENRLPCALTPLKAQLEPGQSVQLVSLAGFSPNDEMLADFLPAFQTDADVQKASVDSKEVLDDVLLPAFTVSGQPLVDAYSKQNYLDNVLRGGVPHLLPSRQGDTPLHIYSRRHGDLERDYNFFELPPHPLSSGVGNYRDICQNRRCDNWFYPQLWDQEIRMFAELLQADGYNPLGIKGYYWQLSDESQAASLCPVKDEEAQKEFLGIFHKEFHPGQLLHWVDKYKVELKDRKAWLSDILAKCDRKLVAGGCEGGYWVDHWDYIVDLLESFAAIYPDHIDQVLTEKADIGWFYEGTKVADRRDKYIILPSGVPLQLDAVDENAGAQMDLPPVTVLGKLCALLAIKAVSFDHDLKGIEMEAGRPGWNDSMNGLPGLFGSSSCESAEVAALAGWLLENLKAIPNTEMPVAVADLIDQVVNDFADAYDWNKNVQIRENFRHSVYGCQSKNTRTVSSQTLTALLEGTKARAEKAVNNSYDPKSGMVHTFFKGVPLDVEPQKNADGSIRYKPGRENTPFAKITKFKQEPLPLFLEGQVRWLRTFNDAKKAKEIYQAVRKSPVFDDKIKMYKLNECLNDCPQEIGRARTFTRGWFENESVWMHMSYKYLLELLRQGLYEEFYEDAKTMLVPFMDPHVYGRSVLENSSFIASSANPDKNTWARGFVARLSGSTAEFINIWLLMTIGHRPFAMQDGQLTFSIQPALPANWFTSKAVEADWCGHTIQVPENAFACALLGNILLVYHNPQKQDTFGKNGVRPVKYVLDNQDAITGAEITGERAEKIRNREIKRIDVTLG